MVFPLLLTQKNILNFMNFCDNEIQKALVFRSPMIYRKNNRGCRKKEGVATSLYVSYEGQEFLLTVAHTFQEYDFDSLYIDLVNIPLADFTKGAIIYPPQKNNFKANDYCILFVNSKIRQKLQTIFKPFPIHPDAKQCRIIEENYFILGYPSSKNFQWSSCSSNTNIKTFRYCMRLPKENDFQYPSTIYDAQKNIILKCKKRIIITENMFSKIRWWIPRLNGMSGCGIWTISHYPLDVNAKSKYEINGKITEVPHDNFAIPSFSLQGMLTNYDKKNQKIIGFTIQDVIKVIEHVSQCLSSQEIIINSNEHPELFF